MQASSIPTKFQVPWGVDAGASYIRSVPLSQPVSGNGQASLDLGFPPECFTPTGAGGYAPDGRDFNGILNQISAWCQWVAAGGAPIAYDATFQTAIGGYPKGAVVASATNAGVQWLSTADNNTTNPDSGGAGWAALLQTQSQNYAADTGTPNAYIVSLTPPLTAHVVGMPIRVKWASSNTGASTFNDGAGSASLVRRDGSALIGGEIIAGNIDTVVWDGAHFRLDGVAPASNTVAAAGTDTQSAITPAALLSLFGQSLVQPGYQKLPGGLILQWGNFNNSSTGGTPLTFPIAFPNAYLSIVFLDGGNTCYSYGITGLSAAGGTVWAKNPGTGAYVVSAGLWIAVGH